MLILLPAPLFVEKRTFFPLALAGVADAPGEASSIICSACSLALRFSSSMALCRWRCFCTAALGVLVCGLFAAVHPEDAGGWLAALAEALTGVARPERYVDAILASSSADPVEFASSSACGEVSAAGRMLGLLPAGGLAPFRFGPASESTT